jgi:hypothetical protein
MIGIWSVYRWRPGWFAGNRWLLGFAVAAGLVVAVDRLSSLPQDAEVLRVYRALFEALDGGANPYDCNCIPHSVEGGTWRLGNFNYPPTEIWPYYLVYSVFGTSSRALFTATLITLSLGACVMLRLAFPRVSLGIVSCYFPLLVFFELKTNSATALFIVSVIVWLIWRSSHWQNAIREAFLAVVFSVGLLTKFIVIPIFAAFYWSRFRVGRSREFARIVAGAGAAIGLAMLQMAPFGIENVFRETVLFNLVLDTRAELTTYYPNVVSGLFYWLSLKNAFPLVAVFLLGISVLVAPLQRTFSAILTAAITFMFVATTPEPQYVPIILFLALAGSLPAGDLEGKQTPVVRSPAQASSRSRLEGGDAPGEHRHSE